jgi:ferritin-like metal-binding protein YciE
MAAPNARDTKLIQYLNEAYGKERELETALEAHIAMTTRPPYKKRLREHLKETKGHARQLKTRIRELGGKAEAGPISAGPTPVVEAASTLTSVASKAVAAAQGPLHAIRGTGESERMLKNAKTEYHNEAEEIATYTGIEALAGAVNDKETVKLARGIRREEERMAKFLEKQIPQLAKAVAKEEIPAAERRNGASSTRRSSPRRSRSTSNGSSRSSSASGSRSASSRSGTGTKRSASGAKRSASSRSGSGSKGSGSRASSARTSSARSSSSRSASGSSRSATGTKRSASGAKRSAASGRSGSSRSSSSRSGSSSRSRSK